MHEAKTYKHNCWITLTYNDDNLRSRYNTGLLNPKTAKPIYGGTLLKRDIQKFFRRLRKYSTRDGSGLHIAALKPTNFKDTPSTGGSIADLIPVIRYYYCGEYGEKYKRPHYHLCLFGIDFKDKKLVKHSNDEHRLYESELLQKLWPHGQHILSELTWQTAAYTARYSLAKVNGQLQNQLQQYKINNKTISKKHYEQIDNDTGEIITLQQEFNDMSRKPGIGFDWLQKWQTDVYKKDTSHVRIRGNKTQPPRYYDKLYAKKNRTHFDHIKKERSKATLKNYANNRQPRLQAEEIITKSKIKSLKHKLETQ